MSAIAKIEVTVLPAEGCTLIGAAECATTFWTARHNETGEQITVTADDVAWVLTRPLSVMFGDAEERGYGRLWTIKGAEGLGLEMRVEVDE